jgi:GTP pyrophosphokinase
MATSERENRQIDAAQPDIDSATRQFLAELLDSPDSDARVVEAKAIVEILDPFGLPADLRAAVLLYPLARDGDFDPRSLKKEPLADLAVLITGLVQLGRFSLPPNWQPGEALAIQQSEALRKMLLAVVSDARLVLVRIAEQLYRLRQAKTAPAARQKQIAIETREIYAALANRLGVWQLKWELEDLSFRYLEPEIYKQIAISLNEKRNDREAFIEQVQSQIRTELTRNGIAAKISGRPKHIYSIWRKMQRKGSGLEHLFDIRAVRILVDDVSQCYAALGAVHNLWSYIPGEFDDYIANPKENNYQSLHTAIIGPAGQTVEIQIRTFEMHRHAELGVAAHWRYKEGSVARASFDQKIQFLRQLLEPSSQDGDLLDQIRDDVFEDRVYAISPKGDVVEMPADATPLDFAYHVHTMVGHRCRGAKVNGRIVPLTYKVQNGDTIEIITGKEAHPSRDWLSPQLGYLAASRSRTKVRNWFRQRDKEQNKRHGREILEREFTKLNIKDLTAVDIATQLKIKDTDALYVALGAGDITAAGVATALQNLRRDAPAERLPRRRGKHRSASSSPQVAISGVGDLMCNLARCCRPVPPEPVTGYITQGRGVSIHRQDCGNFLSLNAKNPERVIEVDWGGHEDAMYPADLTVAAFDRQGLVRDITAVLADDGVSVDSMRTDTDKKSMQAMIELGLSVPGLATLSRVISRLEQLPNVVSVRRKV